MDVKYIILIVFGIVVFISFFIVVFAFIFCNKVSPRPYSPSRRSTAELKTNSKESWYQTVRNKSPANKSSIEDSDEETSNDIQINGHHEQNRMERKEDEHLTLLDPSDYKDGKMKERIENENIDLLEQSVAKDGRSKEIMEDKNVNMSAPSAPGDDINKERMEEENVNILDPSAPSAAGSSSDSTRSSISLTIQEYTVCDNNGRISITSPQSIRSSTSPHSSTYHLHSSISPNSSVSPNIRELQANLLENIQKRNPNNITRVHPEARRAVPSFLPPSSIENHINIGCNKATARDVSIQRFTKDGTIRNIVFDVDPLDFSVTTRGSTMEKVIKSNGRVRTWLCERGGGFSLNEVDNWSVTDLHYCFAIFRYKDGSLLLEQTLQSGTK